MKQTNTDKTNLTEHRFTHPEQVEDEAKIDRIFYYCDHPTKVIFYWFFVVITCGIFLIFPWWFPKLNTHIKWKKCTPAEATNLLVYSVDTTCTVVRIKNRDFCLDGSIKTYKSFVFRLYTYFFDSNDGLYKPIQFLIQNKTLEDVHKEMGHGIASQKLYDERLLTYGRNSTDVPVRGNFEILIEEVLSPFYIFQLFAVIFWGFFNHYEIYAGFIFVVSIVTLVFSFIKIKQNERKMRERAYFETNIKVYRSYYGESEAKNGKIVNSTELVPGDLIEIPQNEKLPCDVILLDGTCIMNESMLTGESIPIIKQHLPKTNKTFNPSNSEQYILFSGTTCIETRRTRADAPVIGVVLRTSFSTSKGRLVRSFLYSKPENFQFYRDSIKYVGAMALIAVICFAISVKSSIDQGAETDEIFIKAIDIITISVPPALPTTVAIGSTLAAVRLVNQKILTKSEHKINVAGKISVMCFDKTGTLTRDSLDLYGIRAANSDGKNVNGFQGDMTTKINEALNTEGAKTLNHRFIEIMAGCHSLTSLKGEVAGDPLDMKMLEGIGWTLNETVEAAQNRIAHLVPAAGSKGYFAAGHELSIVQRFDFNPKLQRMSAITKDSAEEKQKILVKGSPEMIRTLCKAESIPKDFETVLHNYTQDGLRVIACGSRFLDSNVSYSEDLEREQFENNLEFLGFIIFENKLKEVTPSIIEKLKNADIKTMMLTGDNPLTAIFVAKDCGIIDKNKRVIVGALKNVTEDEKQFSWSYMGESYKAKQADQEAVALKVRDSYHLPEEDIIEMIRNDRDAVIAITGDAYKHITSKCAPESAVQQLLLSHCKVFARMKPDDKAMVVEKLQALGVIVGMCGDGANDCPALKVSNVGISLSDQEASLAAPFSSRILDISAVDIVLREGRTALVTSFQCFKYMSIYSLIQTFSIIICYTKASGFTDLAFLYQDLVIIIPTAFTMSLTHPPKTLSKEQPIGSLLSFPVLTGMIGQCIIQAVVQIVADSILSSQSWYIVPDDFYVLYELAGNEIDDDLVLGDYDNTMLFLIGNIQYIACVLAFSFGAPFRKPFYTNYIFTVCVTVVAIFSVLLIICPMPAIYDFIGIASWEADEDFRLVILLICAINSVITIAYERLFIPLLFKVIQKFQDKAKGQKGQTLAA